MGTQSLGALVVAAAVSVVDNQKRAIGPWKGVPPYWNSVAQALSVLVQASRESSLCSAGKREHQPSLTFLPAKPHQAIGSWAPVEWLQSLLAQDCPVTVSML